MCYGKAFKIILFQRCCIKNFSWNCIFGLFFFLWNFIDFSEHCLFNWNILFCYFKHTIYIHKRIITGIIFCFAVRSLLLWSTEMIIKVPGLYYTDNHKGKIMWHMIFYTIQKMYATLWIKEIFNNNFFKLLLLLLLLLLFCCYCCLTSLIFFSFR